MITFENHLLHTIVHIFTTVCGDFAPFFFFSIEKERFFGGSFRSNTSIQDWLIKFFIMTLNKKVSLPLPYC